MVSFSGKMSLTPEDDVLMSLNFNTKESKHHIDISGLAFAEVLQALYQASKPLKWGMNAPQSPLSKQEAALLVEKNRKGGPWIDYLNGRPLKLDFKGITTTLNIELYDKYNGGTGRAHQVICDLRKCKSSSLPDKHEKIQSEVQGNFSLFKKHLGNQFTDERLKEMARYQAQYDNDSGPTRVKRKPYARLGKLNELTFTDKETLGPNPDFHALETNGKGVFVQQIVNAFSPNKSLIYHCYNAEGLRMVKEKSTKNGCPYKTFKGKLHRT